MKNQIKSFLEKINVDDTSISSILNNLTMLKNNNIFDDFIKIVDSYNSIHINHETLFQKIKEFELTNRLNEYEYDLLFVICLFLKLRKFYEKYKVDENIFWNTALDIKYKLVECQMVKKITGTFVLKWFFGFMAMTRFAFGRLQFEQTKTNFTYPGINQNDDAIAIHIPRSGEPLTNELVEESINKATQFFKRGVDGKLIFKCESWLLFPKTIEFVRENSNIALFAQRFTIVRTRYDDDYHELWRLFDCEIKDIDKLPNDSMLRKKYINLMKNNEKIGESLGFFIY